MSSTRRRIPLARLGWRNTHRNTRRTLLTISAITVAVAALTFAQSYVTGVLGNFLDTYARTETGHIRIRAAGYTERERFMPLHMNVKDLSDLLPLIRRNPSVLEAIPRIRTAVLVDGMESNRPGMLLGIDLEREEGYLGPSEMLLEGRLPRAGRPEVIVGSELADKLGVSVGDSVILLGQTAYRSMGGARLEVTALSEMGMAYFDATFMVAPLDQVQEMTYLDDACTEILLFTDHPQSADSLATAIATDLSLAGGQELEVVSWKDQAQLFRVLDAVKPLFAFILGLLLLMAGLIIVNTMLMTIMERTQEFGMQAALGMRRRDIVVLIVAEGIAIGMMGAIAGSALGSAVGIWLENAGIDITAATRGINIPFQGNIYPDWQLSYALIAAAAGVMTAGLAALYPAWRAIRKTPAEALRA